METKFANTTFLVTFFTVLFIDQISKWLAYQLEMTVINEGISFGLFSLLPSIALTILLVVMIAAVWYPYRFSWKRQPIASGLFFGGGIANLIDRIFFGGVRDWLKVPFLSLHNNLADYAIVLGLIILLFFGLKRSYNHSVQELTPEEK